MLKHRSKDTRFLVLTLVVVLLMGIPTFHSLMETDDLVTEQPSESQNSSGRSPSSVPNKTIVKFGGSLSKFTEYDLNCSNKSAKKQNVAGAFVQLQGKNCLKNYKNGDVEIFNKSNGYTASTLISGSNKYQTDLIQLQNGDNEIVIRYREHSGKTVEEVIRIHSTQI